MSRGPGYATKVSRNGRGRGSRAWADHHATPIRHRLEDTAFHSYSLSHAQTEAILADHVGSNGVCVER